MSPFLPPVVHILLDEHIGIEGLGGDAAADAMKERLRSFYVNNGFRLFGGAYSEVSSTR